MNPDLKQLIVKNTFIDQVRNNMHIDESEYEKLCTALQNLALEWREDKLIDKELVLLLYSMPLMIRNIFLSFSDLGPPLPETANRLEDIWVELDDLVTQCFSGNP